MTEEAAHDVTLPHVERLSRLVEGLAAHWTRRGRFLLELGCGAGEMLQVLWNSGFDVTGVEHDSARLEAAALRLKGRGELQLGADDDAPFEDHAFDYVVLGTALLHDGQQKLEALIAEAGRLAARGILVVFANAWSPWRQCSRLAAFSPVFRGRVRALYPESLPVYSPFAVWRLLRKACPEGRLTVRSLLPGPAGTWETASPFLRQVNSRLLYGPFGSFTALRLDIYPPMTGTGLPLRVRSITASLTETAPLASNSMPPQLRQSVKSGAHHAES
jgi:Methylase involved in ubiquinone/menaquinone biosynthesis